MGKREKERGSGRGFIGEGRRWPWRRGKAKAAGAQSEAGTAAMSARRRAAGGVPPGARGRRAGSWPGRLARPAQFGGRSFFFKHTQEKKKTRIK